MKRTRIRYYQNLGSLETGDKDTRIWMVSIPSDQIRHLKNSLEQKGVVLSAIPKAKVRALPPGSWKPVIIDHHWSSARSPQHLSVN